MKIFQVDAFAEGAFEGNPAAVCLLDRDVDDAWMQSVAAEMNLSETAFVRRTDEGFGLRWFTPLVEVDLCGHATLASAQVLFELGEASERVSFSTRSGVLGAERDGANVRLDFPALPASKTQIPAGLAEAIGVAPIFVGSSRFDLLVELGSEDEIASLTPDFAALAALKARGVIVTAQARAPYDFVSRFLAPSAGIDEDPATGSAHCVLGPYWATKLRRNELLGRQLSRRGATIGVKVFGPRVQLIGQAITILEGDLRV